MTGLRKKAVLAAVAAAVMIASAGGTFLAGVGTALAPEPAQLTSAWLGNSNGATAPALYPNTKVETTVVKWPGTWTSNTTLTAGMPCSPHALGPWADVTRVIQANGNYRKCV